MRQVKSTAKPTRARHYVGALGALLLGTAVLPSAHAQVTPPDAATKAAMEKRTAARALLSSALARIGSNNNDTSALLDAGRASIELEDYRAALGFLVRAEQASPRDGTVKAALGSAMVHSENPTRALDYFGEAQLLGAPERLFLADRGLARDLLGQQDAAQRDYQLALSIAPNDELTRRYALSLGISGEADRAIQLLTPQLRAQDRGAWRLRAMILAMNGRDKEATEIVNATMPPAMAQNITPYLVQLDRLNPAQQAAAAHFGRFPNGQLGPKRRPVQVAAATPPPAAPPAATTARRPAAVDRRRTMASATPAPSPAPAPANVVRKPDPAPAARPAAVAAPPSAAPAPAPAPTPVPAPSSVMSSASTPAAARAPVGAAVDAGKGPVGPGFSIADMGRSAPTTNAAASAMPDTPAAMASPAAAPAPAPAAAAPLASLADIVGSIEIPAAELAQSGNAVGADTLARLMDDKRKAEAAEAAKREKDAAAAKAKAEADARAKEEAAEKKANPARIWVQVATGANAKALATDFGKFAKKSPAVFKGKSGAIAEWGKTRRLLVGPFKDRKAAQDWLADHKKAGGDGFLFNSEAGQSVDPIK
ncbi:MAG: tetratricopeptide repeat protein [Sphingopyxis sp.]|uniref:tetratricopeptide repeat protein n=1 Tax=Sphingopyxis sp. TaxID=1908224 RepID=UPI001A22CB25|nr:SPOR domain-containing protein [Sphingopyxis sp.]MBJ7501911.1 tetratricopeptide repeat protein [Sphingopyxis sp.]